MDENKRNLDIERITQLGDFWDEHSVVDFWDETHEVDSEILTTARSRYLVALDPNLLQRLQNEARQRGLSTESLVNLFLEQHLAQI